MIKNIYVTNYLGETLILELTSPEKSGFVINSIDGLGPVKAEINTAASLYEDGSTFNSARLGERNIVFELEFYPTVNESVEVLRRKTYKYFPIKRPITIVIETDTQTRYCTGYVETNEPSVFEKETKTNISILCPDPFFYSLDTTETIFTGVTSSFEFPFSNESLVTSLIEFGVLYINTEATVYYTGGTPTGLKIHVNFTGSVTTLSIININTGENMVINTTKLAALTGSTFMSGDELYIETNNGHKGIRLFRSGIWLNVLNTIDIIADWFQLQPGDNLFTYTAATGLDRMTFRTEHQTIDEGI